MRKVTISKNGKILTNVFVQGQTAKSAIKRVKNLIGFENLGNLQFYII